MADYVPSAIVMVGSLMTIGILSAIRVPLLIITVVAIFAFAYVWARHQTLFGPQYKVAQLLNTFTNYAPYILVTVVIFLALGYVIFLRGLTRPRGAFAATTAAVAPIAMAPLNMVRPSNTSANILSSNRNRLLNNASRNRENLLSALERAV